MNEQPFDASDLLQITALGPGIIKQQPQTGEEEGFLNLYIVGQVNDYYKVQTSDGGFVFTITPNGPVQLIWSGDEPIGRYNPTTGCIVLNKDFMEGFTDQTPIYEDEACSDAVPEQREKAYVSLNIGYKTQGGYHHPGLKAKSKYARKPKRKRRAKS